MSKRTWLLVGGGIVIVVLLIWLAGRYAWLDQHWHEGLDVLGVVATVAVASLAALAWLGVKEERRIGFQLEQLVALNDWFATLRRSDGHVPRPPGLTAEDQRPGW